MSDSDDEPAASLCSSSSSELIDELDELHAFGDQLADYLLELKNKRILAASNVCIIAFYCVRSGVPGSSLRNLAFRPNAPSGHYQRHLDTVLADDADGLMSTLTIPSFDKVTGIRTTYNVSVLHPHEVLADELRGSTEPVIDNVPRSW